MRSLGLRPSAFVDIGSVWNIKKPQLDDIPGTCLVPGVGTADDTIEEIPVGNTQTCEQRFGTGSTYRGDGFKEFSSGMNVQDMGTVLRDAVAEYISEIGDVSPRLDGRIQVLR